MVSLVAIANASWGRDVLCKDGEVKHNVRYSKTLSFVSCGTLAKHISQKTQDILPGSAAVKAELLKSMKEQVGQDQQKKAELHGKVEKKINELIALTNKSLKADTKLPEDCKIDIKALQQQALQTQEETPKSPTDEKKEEGVAATAVVTPAAATSVMSEQRRIEEPVVSAQAEPKQKAKRRSQVDVLTEEKDRFISNRKYYSTSRV